MPSNAMGYPNPSPPHFAGIVNAQSLTMQILSAWLVDALNYPTEMELSVHPQEVDDLVVYMLTLWDPGYNPSI